MLAGLHRAIFQMKILEYQVVGLMRFHFGAIAQQNRASKISSSISPSECPLLKVTCGSQLTSAHVRVLCVCVRAGDHHISVEYV